MADLRKGSAFPRVLPLQLISSDPAGRLSLPAGSEEERRSQLRKAAGFPQVRRHSRWPPADGDDFDVYNAALHLDVARGLCYGQRHDYIRVC